MITYNSPSQLSIEEFKTPFELKLKSTNRWVKFSSLLPWDKLANVYLCCLDNKMGRPSIDARIVIGSLVIKHKLKLSDRETIDMISENPYMQYFLGLNEFQPEPLFDPSLFVELRKRMGNLEFDKLNKIIIEESLGEETPVKKSKRKKHENDPPIQSSEASHTEGNEKSNKGSLKIDATVADQYIKYPTDLDLLNDSREWCEKIIDILYEKSDLPKKPRTYRRGARKDYLAIAKKKHRTEKEIRKGIKFQLGYLRRDFKYIDNMLDMFEDKEFPLSRREQRYLFVIRTVFEQQKYMYENKTHVCPHRIVSLHQPHARPIVRGKQKAPVEFGAKLGLSLDNRSL